MDKAAAPGHQLTSINLQERLVRHEKGAVNDAAEAERESPLSTTVRSLTSYGDPLRNAIR